MKSRIMGLLTTPSARNNRTPCPSWRRKVCRFRTQLSHRWGGCHRKPAERNVPIVARNSWHSFSVLSDSHVSCVATQFLVDLFLCGWSRRMKFSSKNDVQRTRKFYVDKLWNLTEELNMFYPQNWSNMADRILQEYTTEVYIATKHKGWDGNENDGVAELQWTFAGSLLYSITVITTIGKHLIIKASLLFLNF